ncbi:MAG: hypothetical protein F4185_04335 [Chloroflexi bacterium]|nr:hypothetical protein [Chloroflexota bacterium]
MSTPSSSMWSSRALMSAASRAAVGNSGPTFWFMRQARPSRNQYLSVFAPSSRTSTMGRNRASSSRMKSNVRGVSMTWQSASMTRV